MTALGVDIGGTFTDFVVLHDGAIRIYKLPSTPDDPSRSFLQGVEALQIPVGTRYVHGSTVATNAVLERRGVRTALITSEGFRDVLELARQTRNELYSLAPTKPRPVIPRELCFEVPERVDRDGQVLVPLDEARVEEVLDQIVAAGAESVAVVFLFSFTHPEHERIVGERARARGLSVSLSCEILPEYREYERASTTSVNAYVAPLMDRYLGRLDQQLEKHQRERLQIMQSNGGVISVSVARKEAVRTVLSGPAGGVMGAWRVGSLAGFSRLLAFDMGGTSTDVSLIDGEPCVSTEGGTISGLPIRIPMLDIHTVGAGGGSLVRVDAGGALRVGPESAGADPGPAAYGRGERPTVTDANLLLGRLVPDRFLGGRMRLHPERSRSALERLESALGLSPEDTAAGIVDVANAQMARALRRVSVERGHDPRRCCLVAFGGSGPLHACDLARQMGIPHVLIPRYPGILSALGMLMSDLRKEYSRTVMHPLEGVLSAIAPLRAELEARARKDMAAEGAAPEETDFSFWLDMRYQGQSYELSIPLGAVNADERGLRHAFDDAHRLRYGAASPEARCEVVNVRLRAVGRTPRPELPYGDPCPDLPAPEPAGQAEIYLSGQSRACPVFERQTLHPGHAIAGPAVITQEDATTWLPPAWTAAVDGWYNLVAVPSSP